MSAAAIPQVALVMGSSTAGGAYVPAMSDETVIVKGTGTIFLGGPPLVKAATGEEVSAEDLGGASVNMRRSSIAHHEALDDEHAIALGRSIVRHLERKPPTPPWDRRDPEEPAVSADGSSGSAHLYAAISADTRRSVPVRELIARLIDGGRFPRVQAALRRNAGEWVRPHRRLGRSRSSPTTGNLFSRSALKGAHFIELACQRQISLVFLQNITGFLGGREPEAGGTAKDGAKLVTAVATAAVPKFTVLIGGWRLGAGNYAMAGRAYRTPRFLWTWPNSRISVDGRPAGGAGAVDGPRVVDRRAGDGRPRRSARPSRQATSRRRTSARARPISPPRGGSGTTA